MRSCYIEEKEEKGGRKLCLKFIAFSVQIPPVFSLSSLYTSLIHLSTHVTGGEEIGDPVASFPHR